MKKYYLLVLASLFVCTIAAQGQDADSLFNLSLDELMNIPIQSASKKKETLFDAPLSSYTITATEIERSGATSIPDALRLAPGVIVREQTNGVYDVSIRGLDNVTQGDVAYSASNLSTLVMIDNRPVFNNNLGGVFWESLPVDLAEVERIEVVRGPSAPLFGPNAVSGVINIITRRATTKNQATVRAVGATPLSPMATAYYGSQVNEKLSLNFSLNYQTRERWDDAENLLIATDPLGNATQASFVQTEQLPAAIRDNFPDIDNAVERFGANTFIHITPSSDLSIDFSGGYQSSGANKRFVPNTGTNTAWVETKSAYANVAAKYKGLNVRTSYWGGDEDLSVSAPPGRYQFDVFDAMIDYEIKVGEIGSIVPGVSYMRTSFDNTEYLGTEITYFPREASINTQSGYIRSDWQFTDQWRFIAAGRIDKFSLPDESYLAYEFASTYTIGNNIIRAAITRSNSGSFAGLTSVDFPGGPGLTIRGNENLELYRIDMIEVGFRGQLSKQLQLDFDVFRQKASNVSAYTVSAGSFVPQLGIFVPSLIQIQNTDIEATQTGITASLNYVPNDIIQFKPFITWQQTDVDNIPDTFILPSLNPSLTYSSREHKASPAIFGGWYLNVRPGKWNFNLSGFYFGKQDVYAGNVGVQVPQLPGLPTENDGKLLLNARIGYSINQQFTVFALGRNILAQDSREFSFADKIGALWGLGLNFDLR